MRTHEEFCAEILTRKNKIVKKRKERKRVALSCIPFLLCIAIFASVGIRDRILVSISPEAAETDGIGGDLPETVMETFVYDEQTDRFPTDGVIESIPPIVAPDNGFEELPEEIPDGIVESVPPLDELPEGDEGIEEGTAWNPPEEDCETQIEIESEDSSFETESEESETEFLSAETGIL